MSILGLNGLTQRARIPQSISNRFFNKLRTLTLSPPKLVKINKKEIYHLFATLQN